MEKSIVFAFFVAVFAPNVAGKPDLSATPFQPIVLEAGKELLIECIVRDLGDNSVIWNRNLNGKTELLTVGRSKYIQDPRVSIVHSSAGSEEWILSISDVNITDSGLYTCETSAKDTPKAYRSVIVTSHLPGIEEIPKDKINEDHSYEDCCKLKGVPQKCLKFCNFQSVLRGSSFELSECSEHVSVFGECMSDGRDHIPCCEEQNIPPVCRGLCTGSYEMPSAVQHYSCAKHTRPLLACISRGIELLPSQPRHIYLIVTSSNNINVTWEAPLQQPQEVTSYKIKLRKLKGFDINGNEINDGEDLGDDDDEKYSTFSVDASKTSHIIDSLEPLTMYEIRMTAENQYGASQSSFRQRVTTREKASTIKEVDTEKTPKVPDIKACCISKGVSVERCLNTLCDPLKSDQAITEDFIICAPWMKNTFGCLANGMDHSSCCEQRGLPKICHPLCSGNVTSINFKHFICISYMPILTNCVLKGYGVLPSSPQKFEISNVRPKWAFMRWDAPSTLANSVIGYHVHYRSLKDNRNRKYQTIGKVSSPYVLEDLQPDTSYEIYVSAATKYGLGDGSSKIIIQTPESFEPGISTQKNKTSDLLQCCRNAGVSEECQPLCDYHSSLETIWKLGEKCQKYIQTTTRCSAGGRDHTQCCIKRNVPAKCVPICVGNSGQSNELLSACVHSSADMIQCMEEGVRKLPGTPRSLFSDHIAPTEITLKWSRPNDSSIVTYYAVFIREESKDFSEKRPYRLAKNITTNEVTLTDLTPVTTYGIHVIAGNKLGTSLPSYSINVITPITDTPSTGGIVAKARPGPLVDFKVSAIGVNFITVAWRPSMHIQHDDKIDYLIYYSVVDNPDKPLRTKNPLNMTTTLNHLRLEKLHYNTMFIIWGYTLSHRGKNITRSLKSDVLLVSTDNPIPANVNGLHLIPKQMFHKEGTDIEALCLTTGMPKPKVEIFLDGTLLKSGVRHNLAVTVKNISRDMKDIICYANNGVNRPHFIEMPLNVVYKPNVKSKQKTINIEKTDKEIILECTVHCNPQSSMIWYKDIGGRQQEINTTPRHSVSLTTRYEDEKYPFYIMTMKITQFDSHDLGVYTCYAENEHGFSEDTVTVTKGKISWGSNMNVKECCKKNNVSSGCLDACVFDIDIQRAMNRPNCIPDLVKMMECASDGSDHRKCCTSKGVPGECINWCRGYEVSETSMCVLGYAKHIVDCFEEGNAILPGPPAKINVELLKNKSSVVVAWEKPKKNGDYVQLYRVFWRERGEHSIGKQVPATGRNKSIHQLKPGKEYEFMVKAFNHYGRSLASDRAYVSIPSEATSLTSQPTSNMSIALACVSFLLISLIIGIAVAFIWKKYSGARLVKTGGVAFENPSYLKDTQSNETEAPKSISSGITMSSLVSGFRAQPNLYEEPKLIT